jgi:hypothetical protein
LSKRFVAIVDRSGNKNNPQSMRPVWRFFGGEGGAAVLWLMPSPDPVQIPEHSYVGLFVPSAPVPLGGGLIYVPTDWVKPGGRRRRAVDECLCVDERHAAGVDAFDHRRRAKKAKSRTARLPKSTV